MSLPSKDDWILKEFTEPHTSSGAKPRTGYPKIFVVRCPSVFRHARYLPDTFQVPWMPSCITQRPADRAHPETHVD